MNKIYAANGGRPRKNDDLLLLQSETDKQTKAPYSGLGALIITGCTVSGTGPYNISNGTLYIDNEIMEFDAVSGVTFPYYISQAAPLLTNYLPYEDSTSKPTRQLIKASGSNTLPIGVEYVTMSTGGGRKYQDTQQQYVQVVGTQTVNGNKTFTGNETFSGANVYNGQNSFTNQFNVTAVGSVTLTGNVSATNISGTINATSHVISNVANGAASADAVNVSQLNAETSARSSADSSLSSSLSSLNSSLSNEITNRTNGDNSLQSQINSIAGVPAGFIGMWYGYSAPSGWIMCDGSGGTPDLRGMFIVGYNPFDGDYNAIGAQGGEKRHTLSVNELPQHNHTFVTGGDKFPDDTTGGYVLGRQNADGRVATYNTSYVGSDFAHESRPPYFTLMYIMKL